MRFVDTNVLLYVISSSPGEARKARIAAEILQSDDLALSVQVLNEFVVQSTRHKGGAGITLEEAAQWVYAWLRFPVAAPTAESVLRSIEITRKYSVSYWDAAVIEAARSLGCRILLSEDLSHGQIYAGVRVQNPFRKLS